MLAAMAAPSFLNLLEDSSEHKEVVYMCCESFLEAYFTHDVDAMDEGIVKSSAQKLKKVLEPLAVLINPEPGACHTDIHCVSVLVDLDGLKKRESGKNSFLIAVATLLVNNDSWQKKIDECLLKGPKSMQHAVELAELTSTLRDELKDSDKVLSLSPCLKKMAVQLTTFRGALRVGATGSLEKQLKLRLTQIVEATVKLETDTSMLASDHLDVLQKVLQLFSQDKEMHGLSVDLKVWASRMSKVMAQQRLKACASLEDIPWEEIAELLDGLNLQEKSVPDELRDSLLLLTTKSMRSIHGKAGTFVTSIQPHDPVARCKRRSQVLSC